MFAETQPINTTVSEGKTRSANAEIDRFETEEVSNSLLEYFGPAIVGPFVIALFIGSAPFGNIMLFVVPYMIATVIFPLALWGVRRFERGSYEVIDKSWYLTAAALNTLLPWLIRPEPRWSHFALALIFSAITSSDTLTVSLRPDHHWKSLLLVITSSYAGFLVTQQSWVMATYCVAFGLHLSGGHDAIQGVVRHLREERRQSDALASTDPLTGLCNRRGLDQYVQSAVEDREDELLIVAVDIDDFKQINDRFGHHGGDAALVHLAKHMQAAFGPAWLIARSGGDEFTCATTSGTVADAERALLAVPTFICEDTIVTLKVSVGVAAGRPDDSLLRDASAALRLSKHQGKHRVTKVDDALRAELREARRLGAQLADAVHRREIEIWAQPIVHLSEEKAGVVHSYECLARWATPDGVPIPPSKFIPMIEDQRLTRELGEAIITKAAAFLAALDPSVSVAVNVSATHFTSHGFAEFLHRTLARHQLDPRRLTIEITESEDIPTNVGSQAVARQLLEMGVGLAVDDFGTGYASLERLVQFPYSQLKLDRTIVAGAAGSGFEYILEGFGRMSRETDMQIVAEGVESADQAALLARLGVPLAQGFFFGRPQPVDAIVEQRCGELALDGSAQRPTGTSVRSMREEVMIGRLTRSNQPSESAR